MSKTIKPDNLVNEINKILEDFKDATQETVEQAVTSVARESVEKLKSSSPKLTGRYAKDWTVSINKKSKFLYQKVVHNKKHYQLTHLLENGHRLKRGGKTAAHEHIRPVEQWSQDELYDRIKRGISK